MQYRKVLIAHRDGARLLAATPPAGPNRMRLLEQVLQVLANAGFSSAEIAEASFVLNTYIVGVRAGRDAWHAERDSFVQARARGGQALVQVAANLRAVWWQPSAPRRPASL